MLSLFKPFMRNKFALAISIVMCIAICLDKPYFLASAEELLHNNETNKIKDYAQVQRQDIKDKDVVAQSTSSLEQKSYKLHDVDAIMFVSVYPLDADKAMSTSGIYKVALAQSLNQSSFGAEVTKDEQNYSKAQINAIDRISLSNTKLLKINRNNNLHAGDHNIEESCPAQNNEQWQHLVPPNVVSLDKDTKRAIAHDLYETGINYLYGISQQENTQQAISYFKAAMSLGCLEAQYQLGFMYAQCHKVPNNMEKAISLLSDLEKKGYKDAEITLAHIYYRQKEYQKALAYYIKLADEGYEVCQESLGYMYYKGLGVPIDYKKAHEYFLKAASKEHPYAQFLLGEIFSKGLLGEVDETNAKSWYQRACNNGYAKACKIL